MADPATAFALLPELVRLLAEQVRGRKQLAMLRLTNWTFAAAITPILFYDLQVGRGNARRLYDRENCELFRYVRKLTISSERVYFDIHKPVRWLLPKLPNLESFTWYNAPLEAATLRVLHECCPHIKAIHVAFPASLGSGRMGVLNIIENLAAGDPEEDDSREPSAMGRYGWPDFTVFTGLQELSLHNLYEQLPWWRSCLVQVLRKNARSLRHLELSLSRATLIQCHERQRRDAFINFFDRLCDEYGGVTASATSQGEKAATEATETAPPLRLQQLRLGMGVYPHVLRSFMRLADLSHLRHVHIENASVATYDLNVIPMYGSSEYSGIAFDAFGPTLCPNLRSFTLARYRKEVEELFDAVEDPAWARKVAVSCKHMGDGFELATLLRRAGSANRPFPLHLRMLDLDLHRRSVHLNNDEGDAVPSAEQVLADLVAGDDGALEGLAVRMLDDYEAADFEAEDFEFGLQNFDLLLAALPRLVNLTQLALQHNCPEDNMSSKRKLVELAVLLASAAPRLRYVKIYHFGFRIWRVGEGGADVRLEEMDDRELEDVELFHNSVWHPQATCAPLARFGRRY